MLVQKLGRNNQMYLRRGDISLYIHENNDILPGLRSKFISFQSHRGQTRQATILLESLRKMQPIRYRSNSTNVTSQ